MRIGRKLARQLLIWSCSALFAGGLNASPVSSDGRDPSGSELTPRGRHVHGIYLPLRKIITTPVPELVHWVERVGATAVIIDVKDDLGRVTFTRKVEGATSRVHGFYASMADLVSALKAKRIYVIGRIVCFKDNYLYKTVPAAGVHDRRNNEIWRDGIGMAWNNPYSTEVHEYIARIATAAEALGFDEIQLDYVRFPVDLESRYAKFTRRRAGMPRYQAIASLLETVDNAIRLPLSIDVFGVAAYESPDANALGQSLEHLAPHIDAISPMLYLANFSRRYWENPKPSRTYALVHNAVLSIRERLGDSIAVRPLLQAFRFRSKNYGPPFLARQVDAATTAGASGYLFWNQTGNYGTVGQFWKSNALKPHTLTPKSRR